MTSRAVDMSVRFPKGMKKLIERKAKNMGCSQAAVVRFSVAYFFENDIKRELDPLVNDI